LDNTTASVNDAVNSSSRFLYVYGASKPELTTIQNLLDRRTNRRYISTKLNIHELLRNSDKQILEKKLKTTGHPLYSLVPKSKHNKYSLRNISCPRPNWIFIERFNNAFSNRLIFKYNLAF
jgi:hypothetical protein